VDILADAEAVQQSAMFSSHSFAVDRDKGRCE